jgi:hypothetical protein
MTENEGKANGVSSIEQFREAARSDREKRGVLIKLPSGAVAKLVRPTPQEMFLRTGRFPQSLAARIAPQPGVVQRTDPDAVIEFARTQVELVEYIFLSPRVPQDAKPGIDIAYSDIEFALMWARGEVDDEGNPLANFRRDGEKSERAAVS